MWFNPIGWSLSLNRQVDSIYIYCDDVYYISNSFPLSGFSLSAFTFPLSSSLPSVELTQFSMFSLFSPLLSDSLDGVSFLYVKFYLFIFARAGSLLLWRVFF